ncbi:MAG: universal stress protein [Thermodesulfobacteriota bacterium]
MTLWNRILAAVDDKEASLQAVRYLAGVLGGSDTCRVMLLAVLQRPLADAVPDPAQRKALTAEKRRQLSESLAAARKELVEAGIPAANVEAHLEEAGGRTVGETILARQAQGGYGTVVVGRRNLSKAEEFLFGSVSSDVVHRAANFSVWVVA